MARVKELDLLAHRAPQSPRFVCARVKQGLSRVARWALASLALTLSCASVEPWVHALAQRQAAQTSAATATGQPVLFLFGGIGHKTFLGCFCEATSPQSLFNPYGFGNKFSLSSIFNHFSDYGSPYSTQSACNPYATDPPVVVTTTGQFVGRLTLNAYAPAALRLPQLVAWLTALCTTS